MYRAFKKYSVSLEMSLCYCFTILNQRRFNVAEKKQPLKGQSENGSLQNGSKLITNIKYKILFFISIHLLQVSTVGRTKRRQERRGKTNYQRE